MVKVLTHTTYHIITFTNIYVYATHKLLAHECTTTFTALAYERDLSQHFCSTSNKNYVTSPRLKQIDKLLETCLFVYSKQHNPHTLTSFTEKKILFFARCLTFLLLTLMSTSTTRYFCLHANETY